MTKETKHELDIHREAIKEKIKEEMEIFKPKMVMYSFRIDRVTLDGAKVEAARLSMSTTAFIRQAIVEKINNDSRFAALENRLSRLDGKK